MTRTLKSALSEDDLFFPDLIAVFAGTEAPLDPGYVSGPKIRDCFIIEYCYTGKGTLIINDKSFDISAGQCFMAFPGAVVTMTTDLHEPWGKSWMCLYGSKITGYLRSIGVTEESPIFPWSEHHEVLAVINDSIQYVSGICIPNEFDQKICANRLFKLIMNKHTENTSALQTTQNQTDYIKQALQFIDFNFAERISVKEISDHLGLSRTYFSALFKETMNMSAQEYVLKKRMEKACELFKNPYSTVSNVAYSLGYEPNVFTRFFKKHMGISPTQYRNKIKLSSKQPNKK